jgi:hypothetical protein
MRKREEELTTKLSSADLKYSKLFKELETTKLQYEEKVNETLNLKTEVEELIE